jgi:antitoxin component YwqK of YwqJK toxin-antitoxin module
MTYAIGKVRITAVTGSQITFEMIEKTGVVTINGVERSNFKEGAVVQFSEYKYDSPHLIETKFESGAVKESGYMLCGQKMGEWKEFHENGTKKCSYRTDKNGGIEGRYAEFDDQGKIAVEGEYRNGKKTGLWTEYYADKTIKSQGYYYNDAKTGKWIEHDSSGKKVKKKY